VDRVAAVLERPAAREGERWLALLALGATLGFAGWRATCSSRR
jgi:hypothetical protein